MATTQDRSANGARDDGADVSRRVVLRGAVAFGLLGATGLSLSACGDGSTTAAGPAPGSPTPSPSGHRPPGRAAAGPTSKSDLYTRGPEPRPSGGAAAGAPPGGSRPDVATGTASEPVGSRPGDELTTARQPGAGPASPAASPAPLPPGAFARTSEIPVGGGKAFPQQNIVVTQPTAGRFQGFSATCTHARCLVDKVEDGSIICPCHGSRFAIDDGRAERGPALQPLPPEQIVVSPDGAISRG